MTKLVIGNWKMNGRLAKNAALLSELLADPACDAVNVAVAVPAAYLGQVGALLAGRNMGLAAQDVSHFANDGAFTGETSAAMLADVGCRYVLVGHSERRQYFAESAATLTKKLLCCYDAGMLPVYCVGESLADRQAGHPVETVLAQLDEVADALSGRESVLVAYEPVWAIGTGQVATVAQMAEMHEAIRRKLFDIVGGSCNITLLYGGSVKADNVVEIFTLPQVDGALVGGAFLDPLQCKNICHAAAE